jgi:hypothetical protein
MLLLRTCQDEMLEMQYLDSAGKVQIEACVLKREQTQGLS